MLRGSAALAVIFICFSLQPSFSQSITLNPNPVAAGSQFTVTIATGCPGGNCAVEVDYQSKPSVGCNPTYAGGLSSCGSNTCPSNLDNTAPGAQCCLATGAASATATPTAGGKHSQYLICGYLWATSTLYQSSAVESLAGSGGGSGPYSGNGVSNTIITNLCSTYNTVKTVIFVLGLLLMILGGALYAASHILPGQSKGTLQGYGMGMILGGIIGVIIAIIAPYVFQLITSNAALVTYACG